MLLQGWRRGSRGQLKHLEPGFVLPRVLHFLFSGQLGYFIPSCKPSYLPSSVFLTLLFNPKIHLDPNICFQCNNGLAEVPVQKQDFIRVKCHPSRNSKYTNSETSKGVVPTKLEEQSRGSRSDPTDLLGDTASYSYNPLL